MATPELHALLGASSAERWLMCPPSARLTENMEEKESTYAQEGTLAHTLGEFKLRDLFIPGKPSEKKKEVAKIRKDPLYLEEMEWCTDMYRDHVQERCLSYPTKPYVVFEQTVDFSDIVPEGFGTADCLILTPNEINIIDYKHGKGIQVDVVDNPQLKLYAWGAYKRYQALYPNITTVTLHIVQPRNGGVSFWSLTMDELKTWVENVVKPTAAIAWEGKGEFKNGEWCRFCKVSATCRARAEANASCVELDQYKQLPPVLTDEEMGDMLVLLADVSAYHKKVKEYVESQLLAGKDIKGWKLVAGRGSREWDNQLLAFDEFVKNKVVEEAILYDRVPLTVAKLEAELGKKKFAEVAGEHVIKKEGKPTVVPEADKRPKWESATSDFAEFIKTESEDTQ